MKQFLSSLFAIGQHNGFRIASAVNNEEEDEGTAVDEGDADVEDGEDRGAKGTGRGDQPRDDRPVFTDWRVPYRLFEVRKTDESAIPTLRKAFG